MPRLFRWPVLSGTSRGLPIVKVGRFERIGNVGGTTLTADYERPVSNCHLEYLQVAVVDVTGAREKALNPDRHTTD